MGDGVSARERFARAVGIQLMRSPLTRHLTCLTLAVLFVCDEATSKYARLLRDLILTDGVGDKRAA